LTSTQVQTVTAATSSPTDLAILFDNTTGSVRTAFLQELSSSQALSLLDAKDADLSANATTLQTIFSGLRTTVKQQVVANLTSSQLSTLGSLLSGLSIPVSSPFSP
jgi:hypothetical protein